MAVIHILKDGTQLKDITGHVIRMTDAESFYSLLDAVNKRKTKKIHKNTVPQK